MAKFRVSACVFAIACLAGMLNAQTATSGQSSQAPLFKYYVWGQVRSPGAFMLSANADMLELISAAGGPTEQADLSRVVLVRGIDQRRRSINLSQVMNGYQTVTLSPGDIVVVPEAFWYRFQSAFGNALTIVTDMATFVSLYLLISSVTRTTQALGRQR